MLFRSVGAAGVEGWAFTTATVAVEVHPDALREVTLYVPADTPEKTPVVLVYVLPSILKFNPVMEDVTLIVPVDTEQVVCVTETVGAAGVEGCAFTTAIVAVEVHPDALREVTLYVPADTPEKTPVEIGRAHV